MSLKILQKIISSNNNRAYRYYSIKTWDKLFGQKHNNNNYIIDVIWVKKKREKKF